MADIVHGRDDLTTSSQSPSKKTRADAEEITRAHQPPRTDVGPLTLHWVTAIAFLVSLFTGIRIAADALSAPVSHWLNPILPQGEIWTWHFLAGLTLFLAASAHLPRPPPPLFPLAPPRSCRKARSGPGTSSPASRCSSPPRPTSPTCG